MKFDSNKFIINNNGLFSSSTTGYESLVLANNDIPNKKYVDDLIGGGGFWSRNTVGAPFLYPTNANDDIDIGTGTLKFSVPDGGGQKAIEGTITNTTSGASYMYDIVMNGGVGADMIFSKITGVVGKSSGVFYNTFTTAGFGNSTEVCRNNITIGDGDTLYGIRNTFTSALVTERAAYQWGMHNTMSRAYMQYGVYNLLTNNGDDDTGQSVGVRNVLRAANDAFVQKLYGISTTGRTYANDIFYGTFTSTETSAAGTNYGHYIDLSLGTGLNYGVYLEEAAGANSYQIYSVGGKSYFGGKIGIGINAPRGMLHIQDTNAELYLSSTSTFIPTNTKHWGITTSSGNLSLNCYTDDWVTGSPAWTIERTGLYPNLFRLGYGARLAIAPAGGLTTLAATTTSLSATEPQYRAAYSDTVFTDLRTMSDGVLNIDKSIFVKNEGETKPSYFGSIPLITISTNSDVLVSTKEINIEPSSNVRGILATAYYTGATDTTRAFQGFNAFCGTSSACSANLTQTTNGGALRNRSVVSHAGSGLISLVSASVAAISITGSGNITNAIGFSSESPIVSSLITDFSSFRVRGGSIIGAITNRYGLYIENLIGGTNRWGIYQAGITDNNYFAGNIGIGTTTPTGKLDVEGDSAYLPLPNSEQIDANLANSQYTLNIAEGTEVLNIKTKNSSGTVKTFSLPTPVQQSADDLWGKYFTSMVMNGVGGNVAYGAYYTDDKHVICGIKNSYPTTFYIYDTKNGDITERLYTTDWASAQFCQGMVKLGQYLYVLLVDGTAAARVYRYDYTNVSAGGTQMTDTFLGGGSVTWKIGMTSDGTSLFFNHNGKGRTRVGANDTQIDVTNPLGTTFRYTWDGTGTDPNFLTNGISIGSRVRIVGASLNVGNRGCFDVINVTDDYFEINNASGVIESDKTNILFYINLATEMAIATISGTTLTQSSTLRIGTGDTESALYAFDANYGYGYNYDTYVDGGGYTTDNKFRRFNKITGVTIKTCGVAITDTTLRFINFTNTVCTKTENSYGILIHKAPI